MAGFLADSPRGGSPGFQKVVDAFLSGEGLPFAEILSAQRIERIFRKHGCLFGLHGVYTTAVVVWAFLSQVLRDGKEASCQAAVARVGYNLIRTTSAAAALLHDKQPRQISFTSTCQYVLASWMHSPAA